MAPLHARLVSGLAALAQLGCSAQLLETHSCMLSQLFLQAAGTPTPICVSYVLDCSAHADADLGFELEPGIAGATMYVLTQRAKDCLVWTGVSPSLIEPWSEFSGTSYAFCTI